MLAESAIMRIPENDVHRSVLSTSTICASSYLSLTKNRSPRNDSTYTSWSCFITTEVKKNIAFQIPLPRLSSQLSSSCETAGATTASSLARLPQRTAVLCAGLGLPQPGICRFRKLASNLKRRPLSNPHLGSLSEIAYS